MGAHVEGQESPHAPYGSSRVWDEDDIKSPATSKIIPEQLNKNALIDLDFTEIADNTLNDVGPISNR